MAKKKNQRSDPPFGKCISTDQAVETRKQHVRPCSDCPFRRDALKGWLGGFSVDQFVLGAHSGAVMDCHTRKKPAIALDLTEAELDAEIYEQASPHWQCAGVAVYRANLGKRPRPGEAEHLLQSDKDTETVFTNPTEFIQHHSKGCLAGKSSARRAVARKKQRQHEKDS